MAFDDVLQLVRNTHGKESLHGLADEHAGDADVEDARVRAGRVGPPPTCIPHPTDHAPRSARIALMALK